MLLVKPGVYPEQVNLNASGTIDAPFELRAFTGGVVVDGADDFSDPARWVQYGGDVWVATSVSWTPKQVFADGARLAPSTAAPASLPSRSFKWIAGAGLYVNAGGGNPAGHQARIGRRNYGFVANGRTSVALDGFTVTRTEDRGIYLSGACENILLTHNTIRFANKMGIQVVGGFGLLLESNMVSDNNDHGIALIGGASGAVIEDNESFRNVNPTQVSANGIYMYGSSGNTLRRNRLHDNQVSGIHIQTGSNNCVSYLNQSWNNGDHGYNHLGATGTIHVCDVAYGNHRSGFLIQGSSTGTRIYDSIAADNGLGGGGFDLWVDGGSTAGFASNYNLFWNSTSQSPVKHITTAYSSVAAYGTASGQDAQSLQADPRFVSPASGDFHLKAGSPAIDNASSSVSQWPSNDAAGKARADDPATANAGVGPVPYSDRGALEFIPDHAPSVAAPATISVPEAGALAVTVHAADPDGQAIASLTANLSGLPAGSNAVFTPGPGDSTGLLTWTPTYAHAGSYTVTFTAANALTGSATTVITVANVDRAPVVTAAAAASVSETQPLTVTVHAADPDGQAIASLTVNLSGLPAGSNAVFTAGPGDSAGILTWTPTYAHAGSYTVTFTAANALSGSAPTVITVANLDRAPAAVAPETVSAAEGSPLTVTVHAADPDGEAIASLTANLSGLPAGSDAVFAAGPGDSTAILTWTPGYNDAGSYTVSFNAANALTASASTVFTVTNLDRAPVVAVPAAVPVAEGSPLTFVAHATDLDGEAVTWLTAELSGLPAGAAFTADAGDTSGTLTWTPGYSDAGSYTVTFIAVNTLSGSATTAITVGNVDRTPTLVAPTMVSTAEGSTVTVVVHATDIDGEAIASLSASGLPTGAVFRADPGDTSGTLTWTPDYADAGSHTVAFTAANALSASATTLITVDNVDRAPTVTAPAVVAAAEGSPATLTVHAADIDGEVIASLTADLSALPAGAVFTADPGDTTGTLTWTPGYTDAGSYTVTFSAANALSASAIALITVGNVDRAPAVTAPGTASALEASPLTLAVHAADPDGDPLSSLTADLSALPPGAVFIADPGDTSGTLTWTPGYADAGSHTVAFTAANALSASATTLITVANVDRAPTVAAPTVVAAAEGSPVTLTVHAADIDGEPISLAADLSTLPAEATFTADPGDTTGTLSWTPDYGEAGSYTVTFTATNALSGSATTTFTVADVDRAPVAAAPATEFAAESSPVTVAVQAADGDGQAITSLTADLSTLPAGNNAAFTPGPGNTSGILTWTPTFTDAGSYTVTFTAANALSATASTVIGVSNTDRGPTLTVPVAASASEGSAVSVAVQAADFDGDAIASLTADLSDLPAGSNAVFTAGAGDTAGTLTWTPTFNDAGSYTVTFTAANGLSGSASTVLAVADVDRAPTVVAPAAAAAAETIPNTVLVQAADADGQAITSLTANLSGLPAGSNAVFSPGAGNTSGTLIWTPTFDDAGSYTVTFTAANGLSGSAATVITVTNADRAPAVTAPSAVSVPEAGTLTVPIQASDPDGQAIASLAANLSGLPAGNNAVFTPGPGNTSGTLTWTPTYADSGRYTVTFTAANALSGSASTAITVTDVYHPYTSGTFYVDVSNPACSDQGPGTEALPYCSISAALGAHGGPGTALIVKPGVYRERVTIPASGSSDGPLILHAAGNGVVIDGADDFSNPSQWAPYSGNVWLAAGIDWTPLQVFADGARLTASGSSPGNLAPGTFRWVNQVGLCVNVGGGNPASHLVMVGRRKYGFVAYGEEWVTIEGFTVTRAEDRGIYLSDDCTNVNLLHNIVSFASKHGIQATSGYAFVIGSNTVSDNNDHGISITNGVTGSLLEDNESFRNARPGVRAANGIYVHGSSGNVVRRNRLHDNQDTGLHFQNGANNNISYLNRSWNNGDHGFDHLGASGTLHVCDVAWGNYKDGFSIEGNSPGTQIYNCIATDNGLTTNEFDLWVDLGSTPGFTSNYNLFWNSTRQPPVKHIRTLYPSVAAYSAASGQDAQSLQADPRFVNPAAGDFHLNAGSPAIDNANSSVPNWPTSDVEAHARADDPLRPNAGVGPIPYADRGALEYQPAVLAITPAAGTAPLAVTANAAGSLPDGTAVSYRFDFGDGTVAGPQPGPTAAHTYAAGSWTATVTVTAVSGGTSAAAATVAVNAAPVAALAVAPFTGSAPLTVTLNASASSDPDGTIVSYRFDFGDGTAVGPQASPTTSHTFPAGTWMPSVAVTDNGGGSSSAATTVMSLSGAGHAPVVTAAPAVSVAEASPLALAIHAADPDGQPIASLAADLTGLPAGSNAAFTPGPGNTSGVLTWTPTYSDSGSYTVRFTATNDLEGSASTVFTVSNVDRAPSVTAPATANGVAATPLTVNVTATDGDGEPITSLTANLSGLPAGNSVVFVPAAGNTTGTLSWTPVAGDSGRYSVTFTAANALPASATTSITVKPSNRLPSAALSAAPSTGNEPLTVIANASGSGDPDGTIVSYRFDFGDGTVVGPQAGAAASHVYAAGSWTLSVVVTDDDGGVSGVTTPVIVAAVGSGANLVTNPSFEVTTSGWNAYNGSTLQRVVGGFDGTWSLKMSGPASTAQFGATDSPNWVATTPVQGTRYRFTAWVRAASGGSQARLRIREYLDGVRIGATGYFSNTVVLSPLWDELSLDYVAQRSGSTLDLEVENVPVKVGEESQVDNLSIRVVTEAPPALAGGARDNDIAPLGSATAEESPIDLDSADPVWKVRVGPVLSADGSVPRFSRLVLRYQTREVAASEVTISESGSLAPMEVLFDRHDLKTLFAGLPRGRQPVTATLIGERTEGITRLGTLSVEVLGAPEPLRPVLSENPMRERGGIGFATSRPGLLQADLFDASGRRVRRLAGRSEAPAGWHDLTVDGRNDGGTRLAAGIYFYRIVSVDGVATGRLVLLR